MDELKLNYVDCEAYTRLVSRMSWSCTMWIVRRIHGWCYGWVEAKLCWLWGVYMASVTDELKLNYADCEAYTRLVSWMSWSWTMWIARRIHGWCHGWVEAELCGLRGVHTAGVMNELKLNYVDCEAYTRLVSWMSWSWTMWIVRRIHGWCHGWVEAELCGLRGVYTAGVMDELKLNYVDCEAYTRLVSWMSWSWTMWIAKRIHGWCHG